MRRRELSRREKKTGWKEAGKRTAAKKRRSFDRTDENQFSVKDFMSSSVRFSLAELAVMVTA